MWHWIILNYKYYHVNSYIMYKAPMTHLSKFVKAMLHLKFNVTLARVLIKLKHSSYSIIIMMVLIYLLNLTKLHYPMWWIGSSRRRRLCAMYKNKTNWYCPSCEDVTICLIVFFVKLHNTST
jgi:hypothetical protein